LADRAGGNFFADAHRKRPRTKYRPGAGRRDSQRGSPRSQSSQSTTLRARRVPARRAIHDAVIPLQVAVDQAADAPLGAQFRPTCAESPGSLARCAAIWALPALSARRTLVVPWYDRQDPRWLAAKGCRLPAVSSIGYRGRR
jgi:hypothetical protein